MNLNSKKTWGIELIAIISIFLFIFTVGYCAFFGKTMRHYQAEIRKEKIALMQYAEKETLIILDNKTRKTLLMWQKKNPVFYNTINQSITADQLLQLLTVLTQESGFSIMQAEPIFNKNNMKNNFKIKVIGNYADLFLLIDKLDNTAWPFTLKTVHITAKNQFNLLFTVPL